jgi:hypothetical protein
MKARYPLTAAVAVAIAVLAMALFIPPQRAQGGAEALPVMTVAMLPPGMADLFLDEKRNAREQELPSQF